MLNCDEVFVTVIIPCFNAEKHLANTLKSIENQTYKNLQVLLIDDHSLDNTIKIIEDFCERNPSFFLIKNKNKGVSSARNMGLKFATGKYIAFIDSDDIVSPFHIENLVTVAEKHRADLSICAFKKVNEKKDFSKHLFKRPLKDKTSVYDNKEAVTQFLSQKKFEFSVWNKLYRLDIIKNNDLSFIEVCGYNEDSLFNYKYLKNCVLTVYSDYVSYFYVQRKSSLVHGLNVEKKLDAYYSLNNIIKDATNNSIFAIHYAHSIRAALTCEILYYIKKGRYDNPLAINKIIEYITEDVKHLKYCKKVHLYRRLLIPLVPFVAKILLNKRRKKSSNGFSSPDSMKD